MDDAGVGVDVGVGVGIGADVGVDACVDAEGGPFSDAACMSFCFCVGVWRVRFGVGFSSLRDESCFLLGCVRARERNRRSGVS